MAGQLPEPEVVLARLRAPGYGLWTSDGALFNHGIWTRDVTMAARWLLGIRDQYPEADAIAAEVITRVASLQGRHPSLLSGEEPGKMHNEYRDFKLWQAPTSMKSAGRLLSLLWGGSASELRTYFGLDTTPLFILLAYDYWQHDPGILGWSVESYDGGIYTLREVISHAAEWIYSHREHGLVTAQRHNPLSLFFGTWKDSHSAYVRADGSMMNIRQPPAFLIMQTLCVDALAAAGEMLSDYDYGVAAGRLALQAISRMWLEEELFFASAIEQRNGGRQRLQTPMSDAVWLLDSTAFEYLRPQSPQRYVQAIVRRLFSPDFLTDAGIRCRAVGSDDALGMADYHGSWAVWAVENMVFARGLRRQGLPLLAEEIEHRIARACQLGGCYYEFFYVDPTGRVAYDPEALKEAEDQPEVRVQIVPERDLLWTVAANMVIERQEHLSTLGGWQHELETEILAQIGHELQPPQPPSFRPDQLGGVLKTALWAVKNLSRQRFSA